MMPIDYRDGFPYLRAGDAGGFRIRDCMVFRVMNGKETEPWDFWNPATPVPAGFPEGWARAFWKALWVAPCAVLRADQWSSSIVSLLDGMVICWQQDRQQSDCRLESCTPLPHYVQDRPGLDEASFIASLRVPR
jgi:hypothetical protein